MPPDLPPDLRFIKRLVVVLTSVMIVGLIVLIGLLVTRLGMAPAPLSLPDQITLPEGAQAEAVTLASRWVVVMTRADEILLFDRASGALRHRIEITGD